MLRFLSLIIFSQILVCGADAQFRDLAFMNFDDVTLCPASGEETQPPNFDAAPCERVSAGDVDPQGKLIWVRTSINLEATRGSKGEPLSLYVSGKMASEVYLNGVFVGANGKPATDAANEVSGKMDVELHPSQDLFKLGTNEVVLLASSHRGFIKLYRPLHLVGIAPTGVFSDSTLARFDLSIATLSLFLLGALYFGLMAVIGTSRDRSATLSVICFFAAGQLISEVLRGLVSYSYPVHDLRLIAIAGFSLAFGLSVAFHILRTFKVEQTMRWVGGLAVISLIAMLGSKGFDFKALVGMAIPLIGALIATGVWSYKRRARAFVYFIALLSFLLAIVLFQGLFLDTVFFLSVAFFLLLLFLEQALVLASEERERRSEEARANRLEQALAEVEQRAETSHINIKSAGKLERVATNQIVHCRGAGGYSEIHLLGGRTLLHSVSLNELEESLPAIFLRVHRSHLINVMFVESLTRDSSGTGSLSLKDDVSVPVSRRIMPKVREALG
ncbi:MAG: LytTR family transcriptional regulator DNA-binding domain-containing protein [Henriciella sp.]|nr:LytTR family transcriptional regulator DNA-binding domain-containing protein [Henriciella sp.]